MTPAGPTLEFNLDTAPTVPDVPGAALLPGLALHALRAEGAQGDWEINILVTDDAGIQVMHREYMDLDSPTDIMTFPYEDEEGFGPAEPSATGGDIVISIETAAVNAADAGWTLEREMQFLVLHGVLHLLGWDDATAGHRAAMLGRQQAILDDWLTQDR